MKRRLFTIATVCSLLLFVAAGTAWVTSFWWQNGLMRDTTTPGTSPSSTSWSTRANVIVNS